jgi:hypothetical protein
MLSYRILPDKQLVVICNCGVTPMDDCRSCMMKLQEDPEFDPSFRVVNDVTGLTRYYRPDEIRLMARDTMRAAKLALVATRDISYGMSRMYEMLATRADNPRIRTFRRRDEAAVWLGFDPAEIESIFNELKRACSTCADDSEE